MSDHNKLMAKYHERLRAANKPQAPHQQEALREQERPKQINPFKKGPSLADDFSDHAVTPKSVNNLGTVHNLETIKAFNSSTDYIRFTTEIIPNLATANNVSFPVACVIKPLGPTVF
jgi:hypothetical protein